MALNAENALALSDFRPVHSRKNAQKILTRIEEIEAELSSIEAGDIEAGAVDTAELADGALAASAAGRAKMADGFFDAATFAAKVADGAILPAKQVAARAVADAALGLLLTDRFVTISTTGAGGPYAITNTSMFAGQMVVVMMTAFDISTFTAAVVGGTLTIEEAGEGAIIMYDGTNLSAIPFGGADIA